LFAFLLSPVAHVSNRMVVMIPPEEEEKEGEEAAAFIPCLT